MDLYEHQAKQLFGEHRVPLAERQLARTPEQAAASAAHLGGRVVVKAQVKTGGRGKAGGVKVADGPEAARAEAERILGMDIKGHTVRSVLVEEASDIVAEFYLAVLLDRAERAFSAICSAEGGVDIEQVAAERPAAVARQPLPAGRGPDSGTALALCAKAGLPAEAHQGVASALLRLWRVAREEDATLVEVNPLALVGDGRVVALDGKVTLDDNAVFRHHERLPFHEHDGPRDREADARAKGLNYVELDGQVGIIGN
ncbi:ATP-grasp domain-containing protein, partial [Nocardiopsis halophila]|uniref:ATP-grasp domain-containing protein n=1 Tax=Nocardiopsis halophila TaxID=141692 RepID=UPI0003800976